MRNTKLIVKILEMIAVEPLFARWQTFIAAFGSNSQSAEVVFAMLLDSYRQYFRHYHGIAHLVDCFRHLDEIKQELGQPELVEYVLWFHDIVCVPGARSNETLSAAAAAYAATELGLTAEFSRQAVSLILLTNHRGGSSSRDGAYLTDIDLAVLGRDWNGFLDYEHQIRAEYRHLPDAEYRQGRQQVIGQFLQRPSIYRTLYFQERYEQAAQYNLLKLRELLEINSR
jgi:predicted metal-dependent HD superfamily phosphohydrolase